jgi:iron complex transport system substrate-binding protein
MSRRTVVGILIASILIVLLGGCGQKAVVPTGRKITDSFGRTVEIPARPQRIVSLQPSHTEIIFAIGASDSLVGVTNYCDYPPAAKQKEKVGGFQDPSVEKIVALKPDLVIAGSSHKAAVAQLEKLGIPVIAMEAKTLPDVAPLIESIATACGEETKGKQLAAGISARIEAVKKRTQAMDETKRPLVFYELWHDPLTTVGPGSFLNDLITLAGGTNLAADARSAYPAIAPEAVVKRNPDVILYAHKGQRSDDVARRPGWSEVKAVKTGRIVFFDDENIFMRAGPRIADALELLAQSLRP